MSWLVLPLVLTSVLSLVSASGSCLQENAPDQVGKRQALTTSVWNVPLPVTFTSTSSFNYWWPFPPAPTAESLSTTTETELDDTEPTEGVEHSTEDVVALSNSAMISSSPTPALVTTLDENPGLSSASTSTLQITITALPPLTSPPKPSHDASTYPQPVNLISFAPLFGIVGVGVGLVLGWFGYGYWKRRQRMLREQRLGGPEYMGIRDADIDEDEKYFGIADKGILRESEGICSEEVLLDNPHLLKNIDHAPEDANHLTQSTDKQGVSAWPHLGLPMLQRSPLLSGLLGGRARHVEARGDDKDLDFAGNPFTKNIRSPNAPTLFSSVASSDEDDEDYESARRSAMKHGTVKHKSIRGRLADKLRLQFMPGRGFAHRRSRKRDNIRETTPELEEGVLLQNDSLAVGTPETGFQMRNKTRRAGSVFGHGRALSNFSILATDVQTPPKVYALKDPGVSTPTRHASQTNESYDTLFQSGSRRNLGDKFTPLPPRKIRSARKLVSARSTGRRTEIMNDLDGPPKFIIPADVDRRVLPTSPPLLSSPELDTALFFSSSVSLPRHSVEMPAELRGRPEHWTSARFVQRDPSRESPMRRTPLGPRQSKNPACQDLPATGMNALVMDSPPSGAVLSSAPLRRSTARASSLSPTKGGYGVHAMKRSRGRSSTLPSAPMSPKERYEARHTALEKVEAIVERSWSARLLQGGP